MQSLDSNVSTCPPDHREEKIRATYLTGLGGLEDRAAVGSGSHAIVVVVVVGHGDGVGEVVRFGQFVVRDAVAKGFDFSRGFGKDGIRD